MRLNSNSTCSLIPGIDGDLQVVHQAGAQTVLVDIQAMHFDASGHPKHEHSFLRLRYDAVCELRALLDQIEEPVDDRQPRLWSDATFAQPIRPPARSRRRRASA